MRKTRRRAPRRPRPGFWPRLAWCAAMVAGCLGGLTVAALWTMHGSVLAAAGELKPPFGGRKAVNILVLGVDDGQGGLGRSDTMLLARVDTTTRQVTALSIPRDTRVALGEHRWGKINAVHARGGAALAARVVAGLTGVPVDYTLETDFAGFRRLVDVVGGIDLNVEQAMDYEDHWAGLQIHLRPGMQHLDGERAIEYVRYRKSSRHEGGDGSDLSRIGRQRKFLEALALRAMSGANLVRLPQLVREGQRGLQTDLGAGDLLYLGGLAKEIGARRLNVVTVPGKTAMIGGQSYWLPERRRLAAVVRQMESDGAATEVREWETTRS
jgi:LCP family protein required for cell wall assembly